MISRDRRSLRGAGFDLWQAGQLDEPSLRYEQALALADPEHYGLLDYHGEFACVLSALGRHGEAQAHLEAAVSVQRGLDSDDRSTGVVIARLLSSGTSHSAPSPRSSPGCNCPIAFG